MSQTYTINCFDGSDVWNIDLQAMENNFEALRTHFSGVAQPANAIAGMTWYDTVKKVTKRRDSNNNAWHGLMHGDVNTKIWMYKNTALEGWAIDASVVDVVLALKGGALAYNANGGTQAGAWITAVDGHVLTTLEMPAHGHPNVYGYGGGDFSRLGGEGDPPLSMDGATGSTGGGGSHSHAITAFRPAAAIGTLQYLDI
jgi:hypothetical protein